MKTNRTGEMVGPIDQVNQSSKPTADPGDYCFCPRCATRLTPVTDGNLSRSSCPSCGFIHYRNPAPAAGAIVVKEKQILFVKRKYEPKVGLWSLPAGFMEYTESAEECALRELQEETGLEGKITDLSGVYQGGDDPRIQVVLIIYRVEVTGGMEKPGDDAGELGYFSPGGHPELAFAAHRRVLNDFYAQHPGEFG